jgi:uncharacterized protein (DUF1778 family)
MYVDDAEKDLIERAARRSGVSKSSFAADATIEAAHRILGRKLRAPKSTLN